MSLRSFIAVKCLLVWPGLFANTCASASANVNANANTGTNPAALAWQTAGTFSIARTETTVAQFRRFTAATATVTQAERAGGGEVYESGWVRKPGWNWRTPFGGGHARTGTTAAGVNGLFDVGANAWEWVDEPQGGAAAAERRTRGGSWWYGAAQMQAEHVQSKPPDTAAVYIGFRCAHSH